ncbi:MAG TPA: DNA internalization-related competence protein ComEC/Rec2 [Burkholderiales bacterium]|nr:DNA internalization-related competence protein ComEC/Rec2 [Burkholderiales bacterium]
MNILVLASAFAVGAWVLHQQPILPSLTGLSAVVPLAVCAWLCGRLDGTMFRLLRRCSLLAAFGLGGFLWAAGVAQLRLADQLPQHWQGRDVEIEGVIAEMTQPGERSTRFAFEVERVYTIGATIPAHVSLSWYEELQPAGPAASGLRAGQRWRLTARLRRPHGSANPHGFDVEAWMLERGLRASGYVRQQPLPQLLSERVPAPVYLLQRARESVRARLQGALADRDYRGVIVALAIGDQRAIPPGLWKVFTRTGTNHLMAISGLHITMVAGLVFAVVVRIWKRSEALSARLPAARAAIAFGAFAALTYAALSGFAVPAQRAICMLLVVAAALWSGWRWPFSTVLGLALFAVLAIDPMAATAPGFWLSFGAVAAIILAGTSRLRADGWAFTLVRTQWAVTIALVPLLLALFQQVSIVSPLANAVAIPVVSLVVAPMALLAIVLPFDTLAQASHAVMALCMRFLETLAAFPDAAWQQHAPPPWSVPLALAGAAWMLLPRGFPARWLGLVVLAPLFLITPPHPAVGELWLTVLDVGQGTAVVARTRGHALLFDAGPAFSASMDAGERFVVPYLRGEGVRRLDAMLVSHDDTDHSGGAVAVLSALPVTRLWSSLPQTHAAHGYATISERCVHGQAWEWDSVRFEVLHPQAASYNESRLRDNDRSCVLRISSAHGTVLIPGDIESRSEQDLLRDPRAVLAADILVAPHHGSRTSSSDKFIAAVRPRHVVFTVGHRNRFGHPHPQVVARYRSHGVQLHRTDVAGAVTFRLAANGTEIRHWRAQAPRFWHER